MNKDVDVSILIRAKNEEKRIEDTLVGVLSQSYKNFEVIVVDSGSTDKTLEIAKKYPVRIFEINPEDFTYGYASNYGFQRAKGKYVVCLSAHAVPLSKNWLETLISNFKDDKVAAVMCKTLPWPDCNPFDRRGLLKRFNVQKQEITEEIPFIFGTESAAIRKDVWKEINFDETLSYAEDYDWGQKVRKKNYKIIYEPKAKVYHSHNDTLKQLYMRFYSESYAYKVLRIKRYSFLYLLYDLVVGSIYDILYVLFKRDNIKWFFVAPLRRLAINYGRFRGNILKQSCRQVGTKENRNLA